MAAKTKFRGSFTALVTHFKNGSVDEAAFRGLVNWQISEGTNGLVPVGTTGESPTLSHDEHKRVVEWCIEEAKGRVPVIAGAGSNSTKEAIELAEHAEQAGAGAASSPSETWHVIAFEEGRLPARGEVPEREVQRIVARLGAPPSGQANLLAPPG